MKFTQRTRPGELPRYRQEAEDDGKQKVEHSQGWPHFDLKGNCICLCKHCMGPEGCKCSRCAGIGHASCPRADSRNPLTSRSERERIRA